MSAYGITLHGIPFIKTRYLGFSLPQQNFQWVFFSSKNAVNYFFRTQGVQAGVKYAAIGKATAAVLKNFVPHVDFIGREDDTTQVAKAFKDLVDKKEVVLFPGALKSVRTVQQQFHPARVIDLPVYETLIVPVKVNTLYKAVIFTSPSNVEGYFSANHASPGQVFLALGHTTAASIRQYEMPAIVKGLDTEDIFETIAGLFS